MGSDESHFNVSLTARDKVTRQCLQTTTFLKRKESEAESSPGPSAYLPNVLPLGQTGSLKNIHFVSRLNLAVMVVWADFLYILLSISPHRVRLSSRCIAHDKSMHVHSLELIVEELCESRGGRPGLFVLTSLLVSVDVKLY